MRGWTPGSTGYVVRHAAVTSLQAAGEESEECVTALKQRVAELEAQLLSLRAPLAK